MAFTDNCDVFASFHEDGFNRLIFHAMQQRPSLFNYATADVANNPELLCEVISFHPIVTKRGNPLITIEDPLPIPGSSFGLNFAAQIRDLRVDFHPGDEFTVPPELSPPLKEQRLAIRLRFCAGLGCPPDDLVDQFIPLPPDPNVDPPLPDEEIRPLPVGKLLCFCLDVFVTGGVRIKFYRGKAWLEPFLEGIEIVDVQPESLENNLECYIKMLMTLVVLPKLRILFDQIELETIPLVKVILKPTPAPAKVPHNPAIENQLLKAFIDLEFVDPEEV